MPQRGAGGRFVKTARRAAPKRRTRIQRMRAATRTYYTAARSRVHQGTAFIKRLTRGAPNTPLGRPVSRMIAPTIAVGAELKLVATPLPDGDSWIGRIRNGWANYQGSKNPIDLLGGDAYGGNVLSVAAAQIEQNAPSAVVLALESLALGAIGRAVGG